MKGPAQVGASARDQLLHSPWFDRLFLFGPVGVALGLTATASISLEYFVVVVLLDVWLFANPHVIATYTRIGHDKAHIRKHWFLIFLLPPIVLVLVTIVALAYELGGLFTLYFIAQAYHVTRQSFGISRAYRRIDPHAKGDDHLSEGLIYLMPVWGLLHRCATAPDSFYGYPIHLPYVSSALSDAIGVIAVIACVCWVYRQVRLASAGQFNPGYSLFVASHVLVNVAAYILVTDITLGWLAVNIWHNLQYLLFVWVQNVRRDAKFCREDVQRLNNSVKSAGKYLAVCLLLGGAMYEVLNVAGQQLIWLGLPTVLILHFTVNFHHYLVDGVIWKRPPVPAL